MCPTHAYYHMQNPAEAEYDRSELILYEVSMLIEKGLLTDALHILDDAIVARGIVDIVGALTVRGNYSRYL